MVSTARTAAGFTSVTALIVLMLANPTAAQQPTAAQRDAIRSSCRSDFMANCSSVEPGGKEALDCLIAHEARLSPSCRTAVNAIAPKPAAPVAAESAPPKPAAMAPMEAPPKPADAAEESQMKAVQQSCTLNDFMAHCSWIKPSSPEVVLCLKANATELSPACRTAVEGIPGAAPAAAVAPTPAPAPPAKKAPPVKRATVERPVPISPGPAVSAQPTPEQQSAIRAACRSDFMSHCSGVQPGGAEALQCLKRNEAELSPACQGAVAAIGGGAPAAASAAPGMTAPPAVPPLTLPPFMRPRKRLVIMAICDADAQRLCRGTSPLGGQLLNCLAANASALSPNCYEALARASHE
jgi:hypothetical protein